MAGHPSFSSALPWHVRLEEAIADARGSSRRVMLVVGRASCNGTRALVERTLAKEELEEYTRAHFALVAADADALEARVTEIVATLPVRAPTPLIAYLGVDGRVLGSTAGGRPPAVLLNDMLGAVSRK
jgi:thioredoxin-related protein